MSVSDLSGGTIVCRLQWGFNSSKVSFVSDTRLPGRGTKTQDGKEAAAAGVPPRNRPITNEMNECTSILYNVCLLNAVIWTI